MTSGDRAATLEAAAPELRLAPQSVLLAGGMVAGLVVTAGSQPLPTLVWAAAFLFLIAESDLRTRRIPNALTVPAFLGALGLAAVSGGGVALMDSLLGAALAFGLLILPFALRALGAGDVKAMMVLGALFGAQPGLALVVWMVLIGGAYAVAVVALRGELSDLVSRWLHTGLALRTTGKLTYFAPARGTAAGSRMPMGLVIGLSVIAFQLWGTPWGI